MTTLTDHEAGIIEFGDDIERARLFRSLRERFGEIDITAAVQEWEEEWKERKARLEAAAPDLLAALEGMVAGCETLRVSAASPWHDAALAAIAKAKGDTQ